MTKSIRISIGSIVVLCLLPVLGDVSAREPCALDWVCVDAKEAAEHVEIHVRNLQPYPITISLRARTSNLKPSGRRTVTQTIHGNDSFVLLRMSSIDEDKSWNYRYWYDWAIGSLNVDHDDDYLYRLPYAIGRSYYVLQGFGSRFSHRGLERYAVDFYMKEGTPVHAAREGVVVRTVEEHSRGCWEDGCGKFANFIVILHSDGSTGEYYHLQRNGSLVEPGDYVERGQRIGRSGNTGHTTMPHLHFAVYEAAEWGNTRSLPIRYASANGIVKRPRHGGRYVAD